MSFPADYFVFLCYPLLGVLLLWGVKACGHKEWNEDFMSLSQTKAWQGFFAICVMLHHIGQKTCAPWLPEDVIRHGLDVFVSLGYFFVGVFMFYSGYGLYKSYKEKPDYLQGFFGRRYTVPVLVLIFVNFFFLFVRFSQGENVSFTTPFHVTGPQMANGYSWFLYVLLLFYLIFYLAFRFCKKEGVAIFFVTLAVLLYMIHCDWWMYGGWWYNSVILFVVGILFARYKEQITEAVKNHYIPWLIAVTVWTIFFFVLSEYTQPLADLFGIAYVYNVGRWVILLGQILAACGFTAFVCLLGMKIKIGNRALGFLGGLTLEIYMLHCLFLQIFGYKEAFQYEETLSQPPHVKNVALLVLLVLVSTLVSAFIMQKLFAWLIKMVTKQKELCAAVQRDFKKFLLGAFILIVVITAGMSMSDYRRSKDMEEKVTEYEKENITYADVDGKKMAAYVTGEGTHTIVLLRGVYDPCPTITLKPMADVLAENNRVIILDYLGNGFSDDTDKERTVDQMVYEIHTALESLGVTEPYILAAHELSGLYAQHYAAQYPDEVEALIGLDSMPAARMEDILATAGITADEYCRRLDKFGTVQYATHKLMQTTGYVRLNWRLYEPIFRHGRGREELEIIQEMFIRRAYSANIADEIRHEYVNFEELLGETYAQDMPVLLLLSNYSCRGTTYAGSDWEQLHEDLCTNSEIQEIAIMNGNYSFVYYRQNELAKKMQEFIDTLE